MWNDQKSLALTRWCVRLFALALAAADLGSGCTVHTTDQLAALAKAAAAAK